MIRILATLCHLAAGGIGLPAGVEYCNEIVIAEKPVVTERNTEMEACNRAAQLEIAKRLPQGYRVQEYHCATEDEGRFYPRNSV